LLLARPAPLVCGASSGFLFFFSVAATATLPPPLGFFMLSSLLIIGIKLRLGFGFRPYPAACELAIPILIPL
jgi:hypothetical protein